MSNDIYHHQSKKIPATVITGFLGSGKTSLIQHLIATANGRRLAFIINEFGASTRAGWTAEQQADAERLISANDIVPDKTWLYLVVLVLIIAIFRVLSIAALARRARKFF